MEYKWKYILKLFKFFEEFLDGTVGTQKTD